MPWGGKVKPKAVRALHVALSSGRVRDVALRRCGLPGWDAEVLGSGELEVTWCGGGAMEPIAAGPTVRTLRMRAWGSMYVEEYQ